MGFPTRACMELTSDDAMKQSLRLVKDVSLSMSWNAESLPANDTEVAVRIWWRHSTDMQQQQPRSDCEINAILCLRFIAALGNYSD